MSEKYLPLYRKYRPQTFSDVLGQENLVKALTNAIELNKIAHAYLFCGSRGTGKTSCARILAKSLNCVNGPTVEPCGTCASCIDVTNSTPMDVIEIDAASNRKVENAEELIEKVRYAPVNGKFKIFIIDEVHMLSNAAFNALLKTFEEPPPNVIFILATTEPQKVIETIVSRCQRFDFRRITPLDIQARLRYISDLENINITDDALFAIAKNVSGGLRDSIALLDQVSVLGAKEKIDTEMIESLLGKISFKDLYDLINSILKNDLQNALVKLDEVHTKGNDPKSVIENLTSAFRNLLIVKNSKDNKIIHNLTLLSDDQISQLQSIDCQNAIQIIEKLCEYSKEIKFASNPHLWAELALIDICQPKTGEASIQVSKPVPEIKPVSIQPIQPKKEELIVEKALTEEPKITEQEEPKSIANQEPEPIEVKSIEIEPPLQTKAEEPRPAQAEQTAVVQAPSSSSGKDLWGEILQNIESIPARSFYSNISKPVKISNESVVLAFSNENLLKQGQSETKKTSLIKALETKFGSNIPELTLRTLQASDEVIDMPSRPLAPKPPSSNAVQDENVEIDEEEYFPKKEAPQKDYDDQVKMIVDIFDGKIMD